MKQTEPGPKVECLKEHRITTVFANVRVKRRLYRISNGDCGFLSGEKMGLAEGCHMSPKVKQPATFISSHLPFHLRNKAMATKQSPK
jgi:hypothetical protein